MVTAANFLFFGLYASHCRPPIDFVTTGVLKGCAGCAQAHPNV
jgi:hypothetical protein